VRRVSNRQFAPPPPPPPPPPPIQAPAGEAGAPLQAAPAEALTGKAVAVRLSRYRYVVGSFVIRIPVTTSAAIRAPEATTLAIMKWRLANMSPANRWVPVLERYIAYCAARLNGVGGNAGEVPGSLNYIPPQWLAGGGTAERTVCGKVAEVLFDCHGDFTGFVIADCCDRHRFESRERTIGDLALRACQLALRLCVTIDPQCNRITRITAAP